MKLINKTGNNLLHTENENGKTVNYFLAIGKFEDIPDHVAKKWLKIKGVEKYVAPKEHETLQKENEKLKELEKAYEELKKTHETLQKENEKLKEKSTQNDKPQETNNK